MVRLTTVWVVAAELNTTGDWGFYFRVTDERGDGMSDLRFHPLAAPESARNQAPVVAPVGS